jgi:hypothetical protein
VYVVVKFSHFNLFLEKCTTGKNETIGRNDTKIVKLWGKGLAGAIIFTMRGPLFKYRHSLKAMNYAHY